jgi:hypothetical protein
MGNPLTILGFSVFASAKFARFVLDDVKRLRWLQDIIRYLDTGKMSAAEAASLAGRLSFASIFLFRRLGRAMLRPLFRQQYHPSRHGVILRPLRTALAWWRTALEECNCEEYLYELPDDGNIDLFCDASGSPGHLAAVLIIGDRAYFCEAPVPQEWADWVIPRNDAQIMAWELLSILYGITAFGDLLAGKTFRIWSDNQAGCHSIIRGGAMAADHNLLVHKFWTLCFARRMNPWLEQIPSDDNLADGPTRSDLQVCWALGAQQVWAHVPPVF